MNNDFCPCCPNHCPKDNLSCGRGREYFSTQNSSNEPKSLRELVIMDLRKCGHLLHHNNVLNTNELMANFSEEELRELHKLLSKFYNSK